MAPIVCTSTKSETHTGSVRRGEGIIPYLNLRHEHEKNRIEGEEAHLQEICEENEEDEEIHIIGRSSASCSTLHGTDCQDGSGNFLLPRRGELLALKSGADTSYADDAHESKVEMNSSLLIVQYDGNKLLKQGQVLCGDDKTKEEGPGCGGEERQGQGGGAGDGDHAVPSSPRLEVGVSGGVSNSSSKVENSAKKGLLSGSGRIVSPNIIMIPPFRNAKKGRDHHSEIIGNAFMMRDMSAAQGNATAAARVIRDREDMHVGLRVDSKIDVKQQGLQAISTSASPFT